MPVSPHSAAGMRIDPPPSDPVAIGTCPAATAAALPPLDPPGERPVSHGLAVRPNTLFVVSAVQASSGVLVLPTTTHPASRRRATNSESAFAGAASANMRDPFVVTKPRASSMSLTPIGTPASGPTSSPAATRASMTAASAYAASPSTATNAPIAASVASIRSSAADTSSRADTSLPATFAASPSTVSSRKSMPRR